MTKSKQIQDLLTRKPNMSAADVAKKLGVSKVTVYAVRSKMRKESELAAPFVPAVVEEVVPMPVINARQIGGNHYTALEIQPWEVIERNQMGFFDGNALKYLMRFRSKGGVQDLEKAKHYLDKLIEMERGRHV